MTYPTLTRQTSLPTTQSEAKWRDSRLMTDDIHVERARYLRRRASRELWADSSLNASIALPDMLPRIHTRRWGSSASTANADAGTPSDSDSLLAYKSMLDADTDSDDEASLNPLVRSWDIDEELQRYHEDVWRWEIELGNRLMEGRSGRERGNGERGPSGRLRRFWSRVRRGCFGWISLRRHNRELRPSDVASDYGVGSVAW